MVLIAVVHTVIDNLPTLPAPQRGLFGLNEPTWIGIGTIAGSLAFLATAVLAGCTWWLAEKTRDLVRSSNEERTQAERHHREALTPIVHLRAASHAKQVSGKDEVTLSLRGTIDNSGTGPATDVEVFFSPEGYGACRFYYGVIGATGADKFERAITYRTPVLVASFLPCKVAVRYKDLFGQLGVVLQQSYDGSAEHLRVDEHVRPGANSQPAVQAALQRYGLRGDENLA